MKRFILSLLLVLSSVSISYGYDIAFINDVGTSTTRTQAIRVNGGPTDVHPNAKLSIIQDDGTERVIVDKGVVDFSVCLDGEHFLVSILETNCVNIFKVNKNTLVRQRITNSANGIWNMQPCETASKIAFISNRDKWINPKSHNRSFTIYSMNKDGTQQERVWHAGLGGVYGLSCGPDGRLYFSSGENQGLKTGAASNWFIWSCNLNGSDFNPEVSAFPQDFGLNSPNDWPVIASNGSLVRAVYYNTRIYGHILVSPKFSLETFPGADTKFGHPFFTKNPPIPNGFGNPASPPLGLPQFARSGWQRIGEYTICPEFTGADWENINALGEKPGMVSHPSPIPGNGILMTWTGNKGDANKNLGVYKMVDITKPLASHKELIKVVDSSDRHEWMAKAVVPYSNIYGIAAPIESEGDIDPKIEAGAPFGSIKTASIDNPEWIFRASLGQVDWIKPNVEDMEYVRIMAFNPMPHFGQEILTSPIADTIQNGPAWNEPLTNFNGLSSEINERMGWYDVLIPIKKWQNSLGEVYLGPNPPAGFNRIMRKDDSTKPDSSFYVQIPANQPWSLQVLNKRKESIFGSTAQTWHQVIPGEGRNCTGCHNHWKPERLPFEDTFAGSPKYPVFRQTKTKYVEYYKDIVPRNLGLDNPRPWYNKDSKSPDLRRSFSDSLTKNSVGWTPEDIEIVAGWQNTGMMAIGTFKGVRLTPESKMGPYWDSMPPTLGFKVVNGKVRYGVIDPDSGVKSFNVKLNGVDATSKFTFNQDNYFYEGPLDNGNYVATVEDNQKNITTIERVVDNSLPQPRVPSGTYVNQNEDMLGKQRSQVPDGQPDHHIKLTGLDPTRPVLSIDIKAGTDADFTPKWKKWSTDAGEEELNPPNGMWWWIKYIPQIFTNPTPELDLYFSVASPLHNFTEYRVYVYYEKFPGDRDVIVVSAPPTPPPVETCEEKLAKLQEQITALQAQVASLTTDNTAKQATITSLNAQITTLQGQVTALIQENNNLKGQVGNVQQLQQQINALNTKIAGLKQQLQALVNNL